MDLYHVCNLNYWVSWRCWEAFFKSHAFYVKREYSKWRNFWFKLERYRFNAMKINNIEFKLTSWHLLCFSPQSVFTWLNLNPLHSHNTHVNHEPQRKWHGRLVSDIWEILLTLEHYFTLFKSNSELSGLCRYSNKYFEKIAQFFLVKHYWSLLLYFNVLNCLSLNFVVQLILQIFEFLLWPFMILVLIEHLNVEVRQKLMDMSHNTITTFSNTIHSQYSIFFIWS